MAKKVKTAATATKSSGLAAKIKAVKDKGLHQINHLQVRALAGTGKTTSAVEGMKEVKGLTPSITPSDQQRAIWDWLKVGGKNGSIRYLAFGNAIAAELKLRLKYCGLDALGCEASTNHALGYSAVRKAYPSLKGPPNKFRTYGLIESIAGISKDKATPEEILISSTAFELVDKVKLTLAATDYDSLDTLANYYDIELPEGKVADVFALVDSVIEASKDPSLDGCVDFNDMVWLPHVHNLPIYKTDLTLIDEAQDLNRAQQAIALRSGRHIGFIGDPNQSIFGFAGAVNDGMQMMFDTLNAQGGCQTLPLTVTRRCGKAIVQEARQYVPDFVAHESNHEGIVSTATWPLLQNGKEIPWEKSYAALTKPGDFLICRVVAPIVGQCFKFIKRNIKANVLGRDIARGLTSLVNKLKAESIPQLVSKLDEWLEAETAKEQSRKIPNENKIITLRDKVDCIIALSEGAQTVNDVLGKIDIVFTDDKTNPGLLFSSIHKAKGLEAERVFFLQPYNGPCPHPMAKKPWQKVQERNIAYVAITRAIKELVYVR